MAKKKRNLESEVDYLTELVLDLIKSETYKSRIGRLKRAGIKICPLCLRPME